MALSATLRHRLDIQGYTCVDDATLAQTQVWLRHVAGALRDSSPRSARRSLRRRSSGGLMIFAALGAVLPFHPFDLIYNLGIRHITGTPELPRNGAPRRFACAHGERLASRDRRALLPPISTSPATCSVARSSRSPR